jgi:aminomethyltransferase
MTLRRTPYFDVHVAAGARMVPFAGFEMPVQYAGVNPEHLAVRSAVGLFDVSHMGEIRVRGPKALDALQWLVSNDLSVTVPGQAQYSALCNREGGVVDDLVVYRLGPDEFLVCVNASNREKDFAWMHAHNPYPVGAEFTDEGDAWAQLAIQGPKALATCQALTQVDLAPIKTYRFTSGTFAGVDGCIIARTGYTGEDGFEVFIPADRALPVWDAIMAAGKPHGIAPIGLGARDTLRLEVRYCLYGHELTDSTSPLQAGLGWITKLDKPGGFCGRDAIVARKATDQAKLCGLVIDGTRIAREGMRVLHDGAEVGYVTSGTRAPSVEKSVALAYVRSDLAKPGTRLVVDVRGKEAVADVVAGPFYKKQERP